MTMMTYTNLEMAEINYDIFRIIADLAELGRAVHRSDKDGAKLNIKQVNVKISEINQKL